MAAKIARSEIMGWWKTGCGDDIIGDLPADSLSGLFGNADDGTYQLSYLTGVLARVFEILNNGRVQYVQESGPLTGILTLREMSILEIGESSEGDDAIESISLEVVERALAAVARAYNDAMGRNPRLSELLASFVFVQTDCLDDEGNSLSIQIGDLAFDRPSVLDRQPLSGP